MVDFVFIHCFSSLNWWAVALWIASMNWAAGFGGIFVAWAGYSMRSYTGTEGSDDGNVGSDGLDGVGMDLDVEITNIDKIEALCNGNVCGNIGSLNQDEFATFEDDLEEDEDDGEDDDHERATTDLF
ncbi:hypothetical protein Droror1_Dr00014365 [Drosera rotundifolia]